ncbi:MAG: CUAEP/CCAEP-tail radical SAM protein [Chloroflexi bacterium]|nr:CUAEP/CCAEP-tail radical SAM protein [Chloroflexota bacterium]
MKIVLISTYELGHQPFGLASPAASLKAAGASVTCLDLAVEALNDRAIAQADLVAFYLPMHTATRLATSFFERIRRLNPTVHLCCFGLYAPVNEAYLRKLGVDTILGGEFESGLIALMRRLRAKEDGPQREPVIALEKQDFLTPDRSGLPPLSKYAFLDLGDNQPRTVGYTEASRGCKHLCRHCPIVPVYNGRFRVVPQEIVLADIRNQVTAGAQHITFGDPDFFNGPGHALPLIQALHAEFPQLTYDVTIKVEHLLKLAEQLPVLRDTGCLFVTSAVEAVDDQILTILDKGHTRANFIRTALLFRENGLTLNPTFVAFNPWISLAGYIDLLHVIRELDLVEQVAPIQYAIRLLIPAGSRLLELPNVQSLVGAFDEAALFYPWAHPDPQVDQLQQTVLQLVQQSEGKGESRRAIFAQIWQMAYQAYLTAENQPATTPIVPALAPPSFVLVDGNRNFTPRLSEPWYC